ncbi:hypothetical protein I7I53_10337 [Histoplasma capsulatum var. duboisii H88]|uniref:Uncharacterized protein n=1 Tax=Ajellomyces capsulatus (strain H88) TaxID=544711 RepID=A0A8A1LCU9_AJEC8|nr:hypothetical protein I7I53_10337 [Histoplasma capsulatum var. duboisii H88]
MLLLLYIQAYIHTYSKYKTTTTRAYAIDARPPTSTLSGAGAGAGSGRVKQPAQPRLASPRLASRIPHPPNYLNCSHKSFKLLA